MSNIEPRSPRRVSRKDRESRAFQLVTAGGVAGAVAVVGLVLAAINLISFAIPLLAAIIAVTCLVLFRRTVGS